MKKLVLAYFVFCLIYIPTSVTAAEPPKNVTLDVSTVHEGDYFAAGETAIISGTVTGDLYTAGGQVIIDGAVQGDVIAAGGTINISGDVTGNIRAAGGQVTISGVVGKNVTMMGGDLDVATNAQVSGNVTALGGNLVVNAPIPGNLKAGVGNVTLASTVDGDVDVAVGQLTLAPKAAIGGNVIYRSENAATIAPEASIAGVVTHHQYDVDGAVNQTKTGINQVGGVLRSVFFWVNLVFSLLVGWLVVSLFPDYVKKTMNTITQKPAQSILVSLAVFVLVPLIFVSLIITLIGIPLALLLIPVLAFMGFLAKTVFSLWIGDRVLVLFQQKRSLLIALVIGVVLSAVISLIRIIGPLYSLVAVLLGFGSLIVTPRLRSV